MSSLADFLDNQGDGEASNAAIIQRALETVRRHLGMEVAYVSQFVENQSRFMQVDAPGLESRIKPGDTQPMDDVYCKHILEGRLPELMPNTADFERAMQMPVTMATPIGAHLSVPIVLNDGHAYGMFCCLSPTAKPTLNHRDLEMMRAFAELTAYQIEAEIEGSRILNDKRARIEQVLQASDSFHIVFQPIWDFDRGLIMGCECLSRFAVAPARSPDQWFSEAAEVGRGAELELASIRAALQASRALPEALYISVNASPAAILSAGFVEAFSEYRRERIILEITEHAPVDDYPQLIEVLGELRRDGMLLAVDDAGAGYSSFQHIIKLQPDIIKLDMEITRNVDTDHGRRALASALIFFAQETGSQILAEGIETTAEMQTLKSLGVTHGQGYLLGRPADLQTTRFLIEESGYIHGSPSSDGRTSRQPGSIEHSH